ncbi:mucin-5AC-like isoform X1 [Amphibalanus amphitrite]|uniref:mucin-5AC-like isoform X1 n=2 Tax=Amphibalanus amphitrite TaxID=1232801 RepID=UPI001C91B035|nr:mucin-5AC-like isoform X1 [Amphibalanus amphitrite]
MASSALGSSEGQGGRPRLGDLRSHITCVLCAGYFIDATTIVECLHTFCRSCILRHLEASSYCPICDVMIHRTKGSSSLRADRILQTMVYKLVPGLFSHEMKMRRDFYDMKPYADPELPSWAKGDVSSYVPHVFTPDEPLQLRLAMFDAESRDDEEAKQQRSTSGVPPVRYLRCQAGTPLTVLQKLIRNKFQLPPNVQVQLIHGRHVLPDDISLMDVGYLHRPPQDAPVRLEYRLVRKRPAPSVTHAETAAVSQDSETKSESKAVASPASTSASTEAVSGPDVSTPAAISSEASVPETSAKESAPESPPATSEPPAKRRRTDEHRPRQPVVVLERLFDADDDEPTSPKEVEDIIASLDAEEEALHGVSASSPAGSGVAGDESVAQNPSPQPGPSAEACESPAAEQRSSEPDRDDGCPSGSDMACEPSVSKDEPGSGGDECTAGGEGCVGHAGASEVVGTGSVDGCNDELCNDAPAILGGNGGDNIDASATAVSCADSAAVGSTSSELTVGAEISTTTEPDTGDVCGGEPKSSDPDDDSNCDEDAASECCLVVDEEALSVSMDTAEAEERSSVDDTPLPSTDACMSSRDGSPQSAEGATSMDTCPSTSNLPEAAPTAEPKDSMEGQSATPDPEPSCTSDTQTMFCGPAKRPEPHVPFESETSPSPDARKADVDSFASPNKPGGSCTVRTTSSVSCGTQDIDKVSGGAPKPSPTKVDCSVQTMTPEVDKYSDSRVNNAVQPQKDTDCRKQTTTQPSQTSRIGAGTSQQERGIRDEVKGTTTKSAKTLQNNISTASHPELASRLTQAAGVDAGQGTFYDKTKAHAVNILRIPNAPAQGEKLQKSTETVAKVATPNKAAGHSPDSSSMRCGSTKHAKASADIKHFFKEVPRSSSGVAKYLEKNHKRVLTGSPLDLSARASKTAADSTSMVPKRSASKSQARKHKPAKAQGTQTIHSIVRNLSRSEHISLTPIPSGAAKPAKTIPPPKQKQQPTFHEPNPASFHFPAGMVPHDFYSSPLHVNTSMASRLSYDMAIRNLLTLSHMAMAQGGMVRPPSHMFPTHPMFPPLPKGHEFHPMSDPSLLRRQSEARMGASAKKASPTAGTTAPPLRTPTALTSASIQHMENLTRTVGKSDPERHSVTLTPIPPK